MPASWLVLIVSVPTHGASARMRIWRAVKACGCAPLRDGVFLLPASTDHRHVLGQLLAEAEREEGSGWVLQVQSQAPGETRRFEALFDRAGEYRQLTATLSAMRAEVTAMAAAELQRQLRKLRRDFEAIRAIDFFPNEASKMADAAWLDFVHLAETQLSHGEPHAGGDAIARLARQDYQGRTWATRRGLWVDRVASAWLIRRFIDEDARFLWLAEPADCPPDALGFDFDGAAFTHVGELVSFEVLLASFGLDDDAGLRRLGAMVHSLDVGGSFVPEAAGFEAMLGGARQRAKGDDRLLSDMSDVLEALYAHFSVAKEPS